MFYHDIMERMDAKTLPDDISLLKQMVTELLAALKSKDQRIGKLQHTLEQFIRERYGRKSERLEDIAPELLLPFMRDYVSEQAQAKEEPKTHSKKETEKEEITYTRNKPKRKKLPADLPRDTIEYDLDESEKVCDCGGASLERIGAETSEQLDYIPSSLRVLEHVQGSIRIAFSRLR